MTAYSLLSAVEGSSRSWALQSALPTTAPFLILLFVFLFTIIISIFEFCFLRDFLLLEPFSPLLFPFTTYTPKLASPSYFYINITL